MTHKIAAISIAAGMLLPQSFSAQSDAARFEFHPHCEATTERENTFGGPMPDSDYMMKLTDGTCAEFEIRDPASRQTDVLSIGDVIDMDIVIHNPGRDDVDRFRAWIAYDTEILEGEQIAISDAFPTPTPGENEFFSEDGVIKISGSAASSRNAEVIPVARIRMRVIATPTLGTPMSFVDITTENDSKTGIFSSDGTDEENISSLSLGYLFVRLDGNDLPPEPDPTDGNGEATTASVSSVSSAQSESSIASSVPATVFTLLQVQGLRVTTEGSSVFLAWDALPSTELVGYNVYYGTVSGRYLQRRGVDKASTTLTLRALPVGDTYYFAVRGVNAAGRETEFSQEVGISVGNPSTSTSPLTANTRPTATPGTNGSVAGNTGPTSILVIFLVISSVIGTFLAFRRQFTASAHS